MVRTAFTLVCLALGAFFLPETAHAQDIAPRSYLFVEVADTTGQTLNEATVRVSDPNGKELLNLKTSRNGTAGATFNRNSGTHHYELHISKSGYLPHESVLFSHNRYDRYAVALTQEIPDAASPANSSGPPLKITLRKTPSTPAELRAAESEDRKRQLLLAVKKGDALSLRKLLQEGVSATTADAKGAPAVAWATFAGDPEVIKLLLEAGAGVRNRTSIAHHALLIYLAEGVVRNRAQAEIVDRLIAAGADVNASSSYRGTVLNNAIV